jgi:mxaA protein
MTIPFRFATAALAMLMAAPAVAQVRAVHLQAPRPFGYFIGDVIRLEADIVVDAPFVLVPGSLPEPRSLNYWLDLRSVTTDDRGVRAGTRRYRLVLVYQTFYAPLDPRSLTIPGFAVTMTDGGTRVDAQVPAWTFLMSPLREIRPQGATPAALLRPDVAPIQVPLVRPLATAIGCGAAALLFLAALARHHAWWPFRPARRRPFARARTALKRGLAGDVRTEGYLAGLIVLHRAFDEAAGRAVMADDARAFVAQAPTFVALEPEIDRFFEASRRAFFGADPAGAMTTLPPAALAAVAARLARAERTAA